jgi:hypothetical protein
MVLNEHQQLLLIQLCDITPGIQIILLSTPLRNLNILP